MKSLTHPRNLLVVISLLFSFSVFSQEKSPIEGQWQMPDNATEIEIKKEGNLYNGIVVKSDKKDAMSKVILKGFKQKGDVWRGKFYAVRKDRLVDATLKEIDKDTLEMEVSAGFMSKTVNLIRVK